MGKSQENCKQMVARPEQLVVRADGHRSETLGSMHDTVIGRAGGHKMITKSPREAMRIRNAFNAEQNKRR